MLVVKIKIKYKIQWNTRARIGYQQVVPVPVASSSDTLFVYKHSLTINRTIGKFPKCLSIYDRVCSYLSGSCVWMSTCLCYLFSDVWILLEKKQSNETSFRHLFSSIATSIHLTNVVSLHECQDNHKIKTNKVFFIFKWRMYVYIPSSNRIEEISLLSPICLREKLSNFV